MQRPMKESQENQQNAETQRERYYATIHKVALQQANTGGVPEKIPGESLLRYGQRTGLLLQLISKYEWKKVRMSAIVALDSSVSGWEQC